jgi:DNA processing protein
MGDLEAWLALARVPGLHAGVLASWIAAGASPPDLLRQSPATLQAIGIAEAAAAAILRPDETAIARDAAWLAGSQRHLVTWGSPEYPPLLAAIPDPPLALFVEGDPLSLVLPQLAMVGSRNPTAIGRETAALFAGHLARSGLAVTSGLALGIDAASHCGALQACGLTIAVLGCGLDTTYPRENAALAGAIVAGGGALVADLPTGTPPLRHHFPRRNRIIAGLAVGTLVVEAALQSGSLITARLAAEQGREVFAIPGSIHSPQSHGCHRLIRQGAKLVENADDIFTELGPLLAGLAAATAPETHEITEFSGRTLDKAQEILLDALGFEPATIDVLAGRTGYGADAVASMLLILELDGKVQQQPDGRYCRRLPGKV